MLAPDPAQVAGEVMFVREVVVIAECRQSTKTITRNSRNEIAGSRICQRRSDGRVGQGYRTDVCADNGAVTVIPTSHNHYAGADNVRHLSRMGLPGRLGLSLGDFREI